MSEDTFTTVYTCSDSIRWVKDTSQVIIVDEQAGKIFTLQGVDAAIWSWLSLRYSYPKLAQLMAALLALPLQEAEQRLLAILRRWHTAGLLEIERRYEPVASCQG